MARRVIVSEARARLDAGLIPPPPPRPPAIPFPELRANALACPHNEPIPEDAPAECGCTRRCAAGRSRKTGGGVTWHDCWFDCDISPRLIPGDG